MPAKAPAGGPCACGKPLVASADRKRGRCWACFSKGADADLAEQLRAWRRQRAAADDVPAFVVFNDTTLMELARSQPTTPAALLRVNGLGPTKVSRYGADLLRVLGGDPAEIA
jgi:DNA helicase II / ATP-dependent DNA helicase PcrA